MAHRTQRADGSVDRPRMLAAVAAARSVLVAEMARMKPFGPLYHVTSAVVVAIDALATMLTGERDHFGERGTVGRPAAARAEQPDD